MCLRAVWPLLHQSLGIRRLVQLSPLDSIRRKRGCCAYQIGIQLQRSLQRGIGALVGSIASVRVGSVEVITLPQSVPYGGIIWIKFGRRLEQGDCLFVRNGIMWD